ncbi:MAG: hypothetical protein JXA97_13290 [Anaerolineales bacterium]|nr:hypothetical protein [Anaerolineales bacterium]
MSITQLKVLSAGLCFLFIFLSGFWLSRSGKPYGAILFNVHKLIAVAAFVYLFITVRQVQQVTPLSPVEIAACLAAGLFFLSTVISGGLVSIEKPMPAAISTMHRLLPYFTALSAAAALYLLFTRK